MARQLPKPYNCKLEQGATWDETCYPPWIIKTSDGTAIFDLTTWTARSHLRKSFNDVTPAATFTCTKTVLTGVVQLSMTATQTAAIPAGDYYYNIELYTAADATVRRVVEGVITVTADATK